MELDKKILSDITIHTKYSKFLPEKGRRESWEELVSRNMEMHIKKYPQLEKNIEKIYKEYVFTKKVLPSMRSLQFGGRAIELNNARIYNCAFLPIDIWAARPRPSRAEFPIFTSFTNFFTKIQLHLIKVLNP